MGHRYASTVVGAPPARSAVVDQSASTVVSAIHAKSAVGDQSASTVVCAISARSARSSKRRLTHHRSRYDEQLTVRVVVSNCTPITEIERVSSNNQTNEPRYRACQSNFDEFQSRLPAEERYFRSCTHPPFTHARSTLIAINNPNRQLASNRSVSASSEASTPSSLRSFHDDDEHSHSHRRLPKFSSSCA